MVISSDDCNFIKQVFPEQAPSSVLSAGSQPLTEQTRADSSMKFTLLSEGMDNKQNKHITE